MAEMDSHMKTKPLGVLSLHVLKKTLEDFRAPGVIKASTDIHRARKLAMYNASVFSRLPKQKTLPNYIILSNRHRILE